MTHESHDSNVFVLAVLGTSPGIITELLWWLAARERSRVIGVEVWTTTTGAAKLLADRHVWEELRSELRAESASVPQPPFDSWEVLSPRELEAPRPSAMAARPFTVVVASGADGGPLEDVRSPGDAESLAGGLHDRVRALRLNLPSEVRIVGTLAGGRKTMSAAIQGAFELQARATDRLLHVLVHPRIEEDNALFRSFSVPSAAMAEKSGVPVGEQVLAYEIPFPLVRDLVTRQVADGAAFDSAPYRELYGMLRRLASSSEPSFEVREERSGRWRVTARVGSETITEMLPRSAGISYAAIVRCGGRASDEVWCRIAREQFGDFVDPDSDAPKKRISRVNKLLQRSVGLAFPQVLVETEGRGAAVRVVSAGKGIAIIERTKRSR
ncbi:CRISPR-associated ring nuclease [Myxococcota bacterium]|nr:CRISPR-associated ring nuclease [Myxococcota bacterium]